MVPIPNDLHAAEDPLCEPDAQAVEIPVIQRVPLERGRFEVRAVTLVLESVTAGGDDWVYLGDGEQQMIEVSAESMRRIAGVLAQAFRSSS